MIRAIIALVTLSAPAAADVTIQHHDPDAAPFATITLKNQHESRMGVWPMTFDTAHGPVVIQYTVTWNGEPDPRDMIEVMELPPNVIARPDVLHVKELSQGDINLYIWQGM